MSFTRVKRMPIIVILKALGLTKDEDIILRELTFEGDSVIIAEGGKGGRGNKSFASATNQVPYEAGEKRGCGRSDPAGSAPV